MSLVIGTVAPKPMPPQQHQQQQQCSRRVITLSTQYMPFHMNSNPNVVFVVPAAPIWFVDPAVWPPLVRAARL
jgi:hypothetical protein